MGIEIGQTISHYKILRKLGHGGMGEVYEAHDEKLDRSVALKVLKPEYVGDEEYRRRFLSEAHSAAAVTHPYIAAIYEADETDGTLFIVMEFVDGRTLRSHLANGPLDIQDAQRYATEVAEGLAHAHQSKLVHRDLKPDNIMVASSGHVKILDFGLAKVVEKRDEATTLSLAAAQPEQTRQGAILGTPAYMSPEQARGESVDSRSDVFSLGSTLYEMVTGKAPFRGATHQDTLAAILRDEPAPVCELNPQVPGELNRIISRCLHKRPEARYEDATELVPALTSVVSKTMERPSRYRGKLSPLRGFFALIAVVVVVGTWALQLRTPELPDGAQTFLVLPFEVRGQSEGADYVGRAFAEALAVNLAPAESLRVLPVPSEHETGGTGQLSSVRLAGQLGAAQLVMGSLTREGTSVAARLTVIDVRDNRVLKGIQRSTVDGSLDFLAIEVARDLIAHAGVGFPQRYEYPTARVVDADIADSVEYIDFIAATRTDDLPAALDATERLLNMFPERFDVLVLRASALVTQHSSEPSPDHFAALNEVLDHLERADAKNPYTEIWRSLATGEQGNPEESESRLTAVLARHDLSDKVRAWALSARAVDRARMEDLDAALMDIREAVRFDPTNSSIMRRLAYTLRTAGRYADARRPAEQAVALQPTYYRNHMVLGLVLSALDSHEEATAAYEKACEMAQDQTNCSLYATALKQIGRIDDARAVAVRADSMTASILGAYNLACFWALDENRTEALRRLRQSVDLGYASIWMSHDPDLASLRGDAEFDRILSIVSERLDSN